MNHLEALKGRIEDKTAKVAVVGLGYVGLPLAVEKAKAGYRVIGLDIQQKRVDMVNAGTNYIGDVVDSDLKDIVASGLLSATTDHTQLRECDCIMICVPTPLDNHYQPDISYVIDSTNKVADTIKEGRLVVLESTTYPGTTEEVLKPIFESKGFICGENFFLAFSPERVDPGNLIYNTKNTPKVVGGVTTKCTEIAAMLYERVLDGAVHRVSSPKVAEMEKILENTYRNINIGLANEMAIICNKMGIDVWEVIDAAKTKPYGFQAFYPGPGVGGHCIPIDPFYLTWKVREYGYHTRLIEVAAEINNSMPEYVVGRAMQMLNERKLCMNGAKILVLGIAYKQDINDYRESPSIKIISLLNREGARVDCYDPHIYEFAIEGKVCRCNTHLPYSEYDMVILSTKHSTFDYDDILKRSKLVFDTKNAFDVKDNQNEHYTKL